MATWSEPRLKLFGFIDIDSKDFLKGDDGKNIEKRFENKVKAMDWVDGYLNKKYSTKIGFDSRQPSVKAFCWYELEIK